MMISSSTMFTPDRRLLIRWAPATEPRSVAVGGDQQLPHQTNVDSSCELCDEAIDKTSVNTPMKTRAIGQIVQRFILSPSWILPKQIVRNRISQTKLAEVTHTLQHLSLDVVKHAHLRCNHDFGCSSRKRLRTDREESDFEQATPLPYLASRRVAASPEIVHVVEVIQSDRRCWSERAYVRKLQEPQLAMFPRACLQYPRVVDEPLETCRSAAGLELLAALLVGLEDIDVFNEEPTQQNTFEH